MESENKPSSPLETSLAELKLQREKIDAAIAALEQVIGLAPSTTGATSFSFSKAGETPKIEFDTFFNLGVAEATKKYLSMVKRPQATGEILEAIRSGGIKTSNGSFYVMISRQARKVGDIVNVNGKWGLPEWYGQKPRPKPSGKNKKSEEPKEEKPKES